MIRSLSLLSFRNLHEASWDFDEGITVIDGKNGSGKTSILEAIYLLCEGFSFRSRSLLDLIDWNSHESILRASLVNPSDKDRTLERALSIHRQKGVTAKKDGVLCKGAASFFGTIPSVIMQPADLEMARGAPEIRRRYLDELLCFRKPRNVDLLRRYRRILLERNQWLKQNRIGQAVGGEDLFAVLTSQWTELAVSVWKERLELVEEIAPNICAYYEKLAGAGDEISVGYKSSVARAGKSLENLRADFVERLSSLDTAERMQGISLAGPHKDDLLLSLHGHEMRSSGSQGQCRSMAISLRLAASDLATRHLSRPVLLLDDIFAELDKDRRFAVAELIREKECQVFVAIPRKEDLPFSANAFISI